MPIIQFLTADESYVATLTRYSRHNAALTAAERLDYSTNFDGCPTSLEGKGEAPLVVNYEAPGAGEKRGTLESVTGGTLTEGNWVVTVAAVSETAGDLTAAKEQRKDEIDAQKNALLKTGKTIDGHVYRGIVSDMGAMTLAKGKAEGRGQNGQKNVSNITNAAEGVITTSGAHQITDGQHVLFADVGGTTELNGNFYRWEGQTSTTGKLKDELGNYIDTSGMGAYTSGGTVTPVIVFITGDNEFVAKTLSEAPPIYNALLDWFEDMSLQGRKHKDAVDALTTVAAVQSYDSNTWPT
jgi:hypothetical protein